MRVLLRRHGSQLASKAGFVLALAVTLWGLSIVLLLDPSRPFWIDEAHVGVRLSQNSWWTITTWRFGESLGRPIGYLLLHKLAISVFANTELTLRILNVLIYASTPFVLYRLNRTLEGGWVSFALASLLLMMSDNFIAAVSNFKPYGIDTLLVLLCLDILVRYIRAPSEDSAAKLLTVLAGSALFAHQVVIISFITTGWIAYHFLGRKLHLHSCRRNARFILASGIWTCENLWHLHYFLDRSSKATGLSRIVRSDYQNFEAPTNPAFFLADFAEKAYEVFTHFSLIHTSADTRFQIVGGDSYLNVLLAICLAASLMVDRFARFQMGPLFLAFIGFEMIASTFLGWPFGPDRWNLPLVGFFLVPLIYGAGRVEERLPLLAFGAVALLTLLHAPLWTSEENRYDGLHYWRHRGLNGTTDSRSLFEGLAPTVSFEEEKRACLVAVAPANWTFMEYYLVHSDHDLDPLSRIYRSGCRVSGRSIVEALSKIPPADHERRVVALLFHTASNDKGTLSDWFDGHCREVEVVRGMRAFGASGLCRSRGISAPEPDPK